MVSDRVDLYNNIYIEIKVDFFTGESMLSDESTILKECYI